MTDKNCSECTRRAWYQRGYQDGQDKAHEWVVEVCERIVEQLKVWEGTSLDSVEECAYKTAIEIVKREGGIV